VLVWLTTPPSPPPQADTTTAAITAIAILNVFLIGILIFENDDI
jgi:hypothetical protein